MRAPKTNVKTGGYDFTLQNCVYIIGPRREKTCLREFANNTGADQPAHPRRLISAFVIRILESIIYGLATGQISSFKLVFVAEQAGLNLTSSETPKTGFLASRPNYSIAYVHAT